MYCSTICFHRLLHSHPLKKLWTFLILRISIESWTLKVVGSENMKLSLDCLREYVPVVPPSNDPVVDPLYDVNGRSSFFNVNTYYKNGTQKGYGVQWYFNIWLLTFIHMVFGTCDACEKIGRLTSRDLTKLNHIIMWYGHNCVLQIN